MNTREAMQALLDGKKVRRSHWVPDAYVHIQNDKLITEDGFGTELCELEESISKYELYEETNPHAKGTFAWAREEARRGQRVCRKAWGPGIAFNQYNFGPGNSFCLENIDATDWQVFT
jgi:hypothetical protein